MAEFILRSLQVGFGLLGAAVLAACSGPTDGAEVERIGSARAAISVDEAVTAGCSSAQLAGLSQQIIAQSNCNQPEAFVLLPQRPNISLGGAVLPYLQPPARDALLTVVDAEPSQSMQINSMLRTVGQQYLLYRWFQLGSCGVALASAPGSSNHETGLGVDVQQYELWRSDLEAAGYVWAGASEPAHFDYAGADAVDYSGLGVLAFQQLWNLNNSQDLIGADGLYGPQTEARLMQAPAEGFAVGPECGRGGAGGFGAGGAGAGGAGGAGAGGAGGGGSIVPQAELALTMALVDADDRFPDGASAGVDDLMVGEDYTLHIDLQNAAVDALDDVVAEVKLPAGFVQARGYSLFSDAGGAFAAISVDEGNPAADQPLAEVFELTFERIEAGTTTRIALPLRALGYSVAEAEPVFLEVAADGVAERLPIDVYDQRRYEWDGDRAEGWAALAGDTAEITPSPSAQALLLSADGGRLAILREDLTLPVEKLGTIALAGLREGANTPASLYVATDGDEVMAAGTRFVLDWPSDGQTHALSIAESALDLEGEQVTGLALVLFDASGDGERKAQLDYLRIGLDAQLRIPGSNPDCSCSTPPPSRQAPPWVWLMGLAAVVPWRRRRHRGRCPPCVQLVVTAQPKRKERTGTRFC